MSSFSRLVPAKDNQAYKLVLPMYISKKYLKELRKHLWRGLFSESCGITYDSLLNVKYYKGRLLQIWRRCYIQY